MSRENRLFRFPLTSGPLVSLISLADELIRKDEEQERPSHGTVYARTGRPPSDERHESCRVPWRPTTAIEWIPAVMDRPGSEFAADDRMVGQDKRTRTLWSDTCGEPAPTTFRTRASRGDDIIPTPASIPLEAPRLPVARAPLLTGKTCQACSQRRMRL